MSQNRGTSLQWNEAQERALLQDILAISKKQGFGETFEVALVKQGRYNQLSIMMPSGSDQVVKVIVTFHTYPATDVPDLEPHGDEVSGRVVALVRERLAMRTQRLLSLADIVTLIQDVVRELDPMKVQSATITPDMVMPPGLPVSLPAALVDALVPQLVTALVPATVKALVPVLVHSLVPTLPSTFESLTGGGSVGETMDARTQNGGHTNMNWWKRLMKRKSTSKPVVAPPVSDVREAYILEAIAESILRDFAKSAPNEYAFICSGVLTTEGTAFVTEYYSGVGNMKVRTPVYCELQETFIEATVYDHMPHSHNLVVWGHVHPIEGPSATDEASFHETAAWDRVVAGQGMPAKRSLIMLVNAHTYNMSLYDPHTMSRVKHIVIAAREKDTAHGKGKNHE